MPAKIAIRTDYSALDLRKLATQSSDARQSRRLLALAAVVDGMSRGDAARVGGMDRQTLRDWVLRFNGEGPEGLLDKPRGGSNSRLSQEQLTELAALVEAGPDPEVNGIVEAFCFEPLPCPIYQPQADRGWRRMRRPWGRSAHRRSGDRLRE